MTHLQSAVVLAALALWLGPCAESGAKKVLSLNRANDGQHVAATVGQPIEISMQTIGGGQYGTPQISSPAIQFEGSAFPKEQNPGGPTQVYRFTAVAVGEAQVRIPHTAENATFTVTIQITNAEPVDGTGQVGRPRLRRASK